MPEKEPYIILVDDDDDDIDKLSSSFGNSEDIRLKPFNSWEKAVYFLEEPGQTAVVPSLIILDYNMPGKNGEQILLLIKGLDKFRNIPVVIYSGTMTPVLKESLISHGALDCYDKTYNRNELAAQVGLFKNIAYSFYQTIDPQFPGRGD